MRQFNTKNKITKTKHNLASNGKNLPILNSVCILGK